jgi:hypothetical protein
MYLGHGGRSFLKIPKTIENFFNGKYNNITQKKFIKNQLYLVSYISYAIVYGLLRYQAFEDVNKANPSFLLPFTELSAIVSGISLLGMLSINEEEKEEKEENPVYPSVKYNALQLGEDMMYEISCIILFGLQSLIAPHQLLPVIFFCMFSDLLSKGIFTLASYYHKEKMACYPSFSCFTDTIFASILTALVDYCVSPYPYSELDQLNIMITPLVFRHLLKKIFSCPPIKEKYQSIEDCIKQKNTRQPEIEEIHEERLEANTEEEAAATDEELDSKAESKSLLKHPQSISRAPQRETFYGRMSRYASAYFFLAPPPEDINMCQPQHNNPNALLSDQKSLNIRNSPERKN